MSSGWPPDSLQWPLALFELSLTVKYTYSTLSHAAISLDTLWLTFSCESLKCPLDFFFSFLFLILGNIPESLLAFPLWATVAVCPCAESLLCTTVMDSCFSFYYLYFVWMFIYLFIFLPLWNISILTGLTEMKFMVTRGWILIILMIFLL